MTDKLPSAAGIAQLTQAQSDYYRRVVFQQVPGSVYLKDLNGVFLDVNEFQLKMAGLTHPSEMIGKDDYVMPWKASAEELRANDRRVVTSGVPETMIESGYVANGEIMVVLTHKAPLRDEEGRVIGLIGTSLDITAREKEAAAMTQAQRQGDEEAQKTILVFAGSLAHDFRTPLMSMEILNESLAQTVVQVQSAAEAGDLAEIEAHLDTIREIGASSDSLLKMLHALITQNLKLLRDSTSPEALQEDFTVCESYKGINQLLMLYPFRDNQRDLIAYDTADHFKFRGNFLMFVRILFNLVSNALRQIEEKGRGKIYISAKEQGDYNVLSFKDTAGGVSEGDLPHLFKGYVSTKAGGTGVGLAFCKATMETFGGQIHAELVEGDCLVFNLIFPKL